MVNQSMHHPYLWENGWCIYGSRGWEVPGKSQGSPPFTSAVQLQVQMVVRMQNQSPKIISIWRRNASNKESQTGQNFSTLHPASQVPFINQSPGQCTALGQPPPLVPIASPASAAQIATSPVQAASQQWPRVETAFWVTLASHFADSQAIHCIKIKPEVLKKFQIEHITHFQTEFSLQFSWTHLQICSHTLASFSFIELPGWRYRLSELSLTLCTSTLV